MAHASQCRPSHSDWQGSCRLTRRQFVGSIVDHRYQVQASPPRPFQPAVLAGAIDAPARSSPIGLATNLPHHLSCAALPARPQLCGSCAGIRWSGLPQTPGTHCDITRTIFCRISALRPGRIQGLSRNPWMRALSPIRSSFTPPAWSLYRGTFYLATTGTFYLAATNLRKTLTSPITAK